jgi:pyroglutamyl-peptidase
VLRSVLPCLLVAACATPVTEEQPDPNAGLLRDFLDGKFDAAGHPVNAKVLRAQDICGAARLTGTCEVALPEGAKSGELVVNVRLAVRAHGSRGEIVKLVLVDDSGNEVAKENLTVSRLRDRAGSIDLPISVSGSAARLRIVPASNAVVELDYVEVFPKHFKLVVSPGSGVLGDADAVTFEIPAGRRIDRLAAGDVDLLPRLDQLVRDRIATRTTTAFRTIISVPVGALLSDRDDIVELHVRAGGNAARAQIRKAAAACNFEGDAAGKKVLVTGFQPFPADGTHENVSAVAVTAMNPAALRGAQVMRLVLPVEYDRAAAAIADVIARCAPDIVISFGQGGNAIALEQTGYNLQDTGELSGGAPDNRGIVRAATPIDETAPAERDTLLPLVDIRSALESLGEAPADSDDPGRYICNNVMFSNIGIMTTRGGRAGFIHLPFTTQFDDAVRARFARVVEAAIQATVDAP